MAFAPPNVAARKASGADNAEAPAFDCNAVIPYPEKFKQMDEEAAPFSWRSAVPAEEQQRRRWDIIVDFVKKLNPLRREKQHDKKDDDQQNSQQ